MSEQDVKTGKVDEAEEVLDVVLPASDEAAEVMHPDEEPLHLPALSVAAQLAPILTPASIAPVRRDHLDVVFLAERAVELVRVVGLVADEPGGELVEEAFRQNVLHMQALGRRSAVDRYRERRTVTSGDSDDLRALAATGGADSEAPLFGRSRRLHPRTLLPDSAFLARADVEPTASPFLPAFRCAPTAGIGGSRSGTADIFPASAPLRPGAQNPEHSVQHLPGAVPRTATIVRSP